MSSEKAPSVKEPIELYFSYFIGRCNPPHQGHFHMINAAIVAANRPEVEGKALILLGSGPKTKYGTDRRTEENPLTFDLKKEIIEKNIYCVKDESVKDEKRERERELELESVILEEPNYEIVEMTNPTTQVIEFVETELKTYDVNTSFKITVEHFCGEKELEDKNKMRFYEAIQTAIQTILTENITSDYNIVAIEKKINKGNVPNETGASMSATQIRTTAFSSKDKFKDDYSCLYGDDTTKVYDAIIEGKRIGEETLFKKQNNTESKTIKKKVCKSEGNKMKKCPLKLPTNNNSGGKRKTSKRRKTNKRKISRSKRRKTKRTNKRKNDLNK